MAKRGFTLIEVLVSVALLALGIVACLGAFGEIARTEYKNRLREEAQRYAVAKIDELLATGDFSVLPSSGTLADYGREDWNWEATSQPSGVENLDAIAVIVEDPRNPNIASAEVTRLVFRYDNLTTTTGDTP